MKKLSDYKLPDSGFMENSECLQAALYSIVYNMGHRYELLPFLSFADFSFDVDGGDLSNCFERSGIIKGIPNQLSKLTGIHGKRVEQCTKKQIFDVCVQNAKRDIPTVLSLDSGKISYHLNFGRQHYGHYVVMLNINEQGYSIYQDPYFYINKKDAVFDEMPLFENHCFYFEFKQSLMQDLRLVLLEELDSYPERGFVKKMENICALICSIDAFRKEIEQYSVPALSPFMVKLKSLIIDRTNLLNCLSKYLPTEEDIHMEWGRCVKNWNDAYLVLLKSIVRKYSIEVIKNAADLFREAVSSEEKIVLEMKDAIKCRSTKKLLEIDGGIT